jgi:hypothetical protein
MSLFSNPEFIRNVRGQLRVSKVVATVVICGAVSLVLGLSFWAQHATAPLGPNNSWMILLKVTIFLQALVLSAGGGIACLNAIHKEKEQNTFDFQRVTRLTPLELTLGKLFGSPVLTYVVFVCFLPLALFAAKMGRAKLSFVVAAYAVLIAGALAFNALGLLISLVTVRGSHSAAILFLLVLLLVGASQGDGGIGMFRLGSVSPFFAAVVVEDGWNVPHAVATDDHRVEVRDVFFGQSMSHLAVLLALDLVFVFWVLLAVVRNVKRDPNYYELYSPFQAVALAVFINFLLVGFFNWRTATPIDDEALLLTLNMIVFFGLGLALLRNRERMRRFLRSREVFQDRWIEFAWPAPLLIAGALITAGMIVAGTAKERDAQVYWSAGFAVVRALFFVIWIVRDVQYLQWMSLRRGKHPLVMGVLYQLIFYACVAALLGAAGVLREPERAPFAAFFLPTPIYVLDHSAWTMRPALWVAAFVLQCAFVGVFVFLQRQIINELDAAGKAPLEATATS